MSPLVIYIFSFWLTLLNNAHENHYSVTNITYSAESDTISLALKINTQDIEFALAHNRNSPIEQSIKESTQEMNNQIINYITSAFSIKINKNEKSKLNFVRKEVIDEDIWVYFTLPGIKEPMNLEIMNALLFDIISGQINLIIVSENGKEQGFKTTFYNRVVTLQINSNLNEKN